MRMRTMLMVGVVTAGLAWARPASAADVVFDPDGTGSTGTVTINTLDQSAGNVIATDLNGVDGAPVTINTLDVGDTFTLLYQANLASALLGSTVQVNGDGTVAGGAAGSADFFTFTAEFSQIVTTDLGVAFIFGLNPDPTATNTFSMYANTISRGDDGTGEGFITSTLILQGSAVTAPEIFAFQSVTGATCGDPTNPNCLLDPNNLNTTAAVDPQTLYGFGSISNMLIDITFADPNYFPGFDLNTLFAFTSTDLGLPFRNVAPTDCFFHNGDADCTDPGEQLGITTVGAVNGLSGPNTMIETDARTNFVTLQETVIPEPATMSLLGFGLLGAAAARRRQLRKAAKQ